MRRSLMVLVGITLAVATLPGEAHAWSGFIENRGQLDESVLYYSATGWR